MEVILKNLKSKIYSLFITSLFLIQLCFGINEQFVKIINNQLPQSKNPNFEFIINTPLNCQTLTYLQQPYLRKLIKYELATSYTYNKQNNVNQINFVGKNFLEKTINKSIEKELKLKNTHYVFYHGQKLEFLLFQDLFKNLYQICFKKKFKNFFMLRVPDKDHAKFKSISDFLKFYINNGKIFEGEKCYFDLNKEIKKLLLSVNPSFLGNVNQHCVSTLEYFLDSMSFSNIKISKKIKNIFNFFRIKPIFQKYQKDIDKLINLLASSCPQKTGLLLQIFIPKNKINDFAYRSFAAGYLYSKLTKDEKYKIEKSLYKKIYQNRALSYLENYPVSSELEKYQQNNLFSSEFSTNKDLEDALHEFNDMQFRLLINEEMLDPDSGIKMFRYFNETENIKQYKKELQILIDQISKEILGKNQK